MASWREFAADAPDLAARVEAILGSRRHKTLATLRRSGAPRVSGLECAIEGGEVRFGMMPGSVKLADVRRDPRVAIHATSDDPPPGSPGEWPGDAKLSGVAGEEAPVAEEQGLRFRLDVTEVVLTRIGEPADHLVMESWHPGRGLARRIRR